MYFKSRGQPFSFRELSDGRLYLFPKSYRKGLRVYPGNSVVPDGTGRNEIHFMGRFAETGFAAIFPGTGNTPIARILGDGYMKISGTGDSGIDSAWQKKY